MTGLDKHPARAAGRVEDRSVIGLDHIDDGLDQRGRCEELAVVMGLLDRELGQEVFIDAPEHVPGGLLDPFAVEQAHEIFQDHGFKDAVVLGQDALEGLEIGLDGVHGLGDQPGKITAGGFFHDGVVTGLLGQPQGAPGDEVGLDNGPLGHPARCLVGLDLPGHQGKAVGRMTQEDDPENGHEVVGGSELGVGAKLIGRPPEVRFQLLDVD